jgi:spermidine synthase
MSALFEELDYRPTPMGALSLRRRRDLLSGGDIYEIKLDDEFLMSSLFTVSEIALARLGLAVLSGTSLDVIVGGLGLGYTARAVLEHAQVGSLLVVDALAEVIEWHHRGLLPLGAELTSDPRCRLVLGDFFARAASEAGFDADHPARRYHAILVDIDHSPKNVLHPSHAAFYTIDGLARLSAHLHPGGVFALWSNDPPDDDVQQVLREVFATSEAHIVAFDNVRKDGEVTNTVYVATRSR